MARRNRRWADEDGEGGRERFWWRVCPGKLDWGTMTSASSSPKTESGVHQSCLRPHSSRMFFLRASLHTSSASPSRLVLIFKYYRHPRCSPRVVVSRCSLKPHPLFLSPFLKAPTESARYITLLSLPSQRPQASRSPSQRFRPSTAITMHRTYSMRQSRAPTASELQNPPPPPSSTKAHRLFGKR